MGFVGREFNKFSPRVKWCIRWFALGVAVMFGFNYGSAQFRSGMCQWLPHYKIFCEETAEQTQVTEVNPAEVADPIWPYILFGGVLIFVILVVTSRIVWRFSEGKNAKISRTLNTVAQLIVVAALVTVVILMLAT